MFLHVTVGEEGRSGVISTSNLANTCVANRSHRLFQLRLIDSGFLACCLEKGSEEAQQERVFSLLGLSVMEKEVRSGQLERPGVPVLT